jgi:hypothetical protein
MEKKKIDLSDYITVNERIIKFYEKYPDGRIIPELISWNDGVVLMKATVYRDHETQNPISVGHAYEVEGSTFINRTSVIENAETSAVGRALALAGFEIKKSVASREEVENAVEQQEILKQEKTQDIPQELKDLYIEKIGPEEGMNEAIRKMQDKGFTFESMIKRLGGAK